MTASERDCEHGQLARSCDRCADAREIAELRDEAKNLRCELDATKRAREAMEAECSRLRAELAAERLACAAICRTQAARWADDRARYAAHECAAAIESAAPYRAGA